MTLPPIPSEIVYAGLLGTVLSLIVATATNNWSMKVFFLLALRLAIGWQFLFEGQNKVNSYYTGPNETTKRFSSEPYFKVGPGPIAPYMRKQFDDPEATITSSTFPARQITPDAFRKLTGEEQAAACPPAVASELDAVEAKGEEAIKKRAEASIKAAEAAAAKAEKDAKTPEDKVKLLAMAAADKKEAEQRLASPAEFSKPFLIAAKAYVRPLGVWRRRPTGEVQIVQWRPHTLPVCADSPPAHRGDEAAVSCGRGDAEHGAGQRHGSRE